MLSAILNLLARLLYPKGRAFKMPFDGWLEKLHTATNEVLADAYNDAQAVLWAVLPDNDNFTAADATDWERRLNIPTVAGVSLADRKAAINRKLNHPGTVKARQAAKYLEAQLQKAGFDVYVHENRFWNGSAWVTKTIQDVLAPYADVGQMGQVQMGDVQMGDVVSYFDEQFDSVQMGEVQMGSVQLAQVVYNNKIANYLEQQRDKYFIEGDNLRATFFIGGENLGEFATVDALRKNEFRQLILQVKPQQMMGYLLVEYG